MNSIKTWKGKPTDFLLALLYFIIYAVVIHLRMTINRKRDRDFHFWEELQNPSGYLLTFFLLFFFMSPVWVYFRKVPAKLILDIENKRLEIYKRKKKLGYNCDKVRYYNRCTRFFYILEIHASFDTKRNGVIEKLATTIVVPNIRLSWNKRKMEEIVREFKNNNIERIENRPHIPITDYFYN